MVWNLADVVFFGVIHLQNPNADVISTTNTILAGVWFGLAYLKTRDLWFVWGLHPDVELDAGRVLWDRSERSHESCLDPAVEGN
jgi:membrane protease YdiL (CAAX protease family)